MKRTQIYVLIDLTRKQIQVRLRFTQNSVSLVVLAGILWEPLYMEGKVRGVRDGGKEGILKRAKWGGGVSSYLGPSLHQRYSNKGSGRGEILLTSRVIPWICSKQ